MTDAYTPLLAGFAFTLEENAAIAAAMLADDPWNFDAPEYRDAIRSAKQRVRDFHLARHEQQCCYCRTILQGGGYFMIDREHVLPKKKFKAFTYAPWNLSVSCKRCNMQFKKDCIAFLIDETTVGPADTGANYTLVHPNFDRWEDHLDRFAVQAFGKTLVSITPREGSDKGAYHYDYFSLEDLMIDNFHNAHGKPPIQGPVADVIRMLARANGQAT